MGETQGKGNGLAYAVVHVPEQHRRPAPLNVRLGEAANWHVYVNCPVRLLACQLRNIF